MQRPYTKIKTPGVRGTSVSEKFAITTLPDSVDDMSPLQKSIIWDYVDDQDARYREHTKLRRRGKDRQNWPSNKSSKALIRQIDRRWARCHGGIADWLGGRSVASVKRPIDGDLHRVENSFVSIAPSPTLVENIHAHHD